jgi:hypothetical protein
MSHILFARPGTKMVEVRTPSYRRPHFDVYVAACSSFGFPHGFACLHADCSRTIALCIADNPCGLECRTQFMTQMV